MKALRAHIKSIVAVVAVVVGLGAAGVVAGGHLSNTKADQFAASHAGGVTKTATTAPAAGSQPAGGGAGIIGQAGETGSGGGDH